MIASGRRGGSLRLGVVAGLLLVLTAGGCGDDRPLRALEAFRSLAARPDLGYRLLLASAPTGVGADRTSSRIEGVVVGHDTAYTTTTSGGIAGRDFVSETIEKDGVTFSRQAGGRWERSGRTGPFGVSDFLSLLAAADLAVLGSVDFEGRRLLRFGSTRPIPITDPSDGRVLAQATSFDLLIDDEGRPVRAEIVAQSEGSDDDAEPIVIEARFADVGGSFSIEAPPVP